MVTIVHHGFIIPKNKCVSENPGFAGHPYYPHFTVAHKPSWAENVKRCPLSLLPPTNSQIRGYHMINHILQLIIEFEICFHVFF
jgi:hypothetical protein